MKYLFLILFTYCSLQCIDKDKNRFDFIDKIVKEPENFEKIVKESKYYDSILTRLQHESYFPKITNHIKTYFYHEKYNIILDKVYQRSYKKNNDSISYWENPILIESKEKNLYFKFIFIDNKWILELVLIQSPYLKSIDGMID